MQQARILAVEPLPPNVELLRRNLALHGSSDLRSGGSGSDAGSGGGRGVWGASGGGSGGKSGCNVTVLPVALGSGAWAAGLHSFTYFPHMPGNSTSAPREKAELQAGAMPASRFADQRTYDCRIVTLSDVIREQRLWRIDLLKIDVEGMELVVLRGVQWEHWPAIRQVYCLQLVS